MRFMACALLVAVAGWANAEPSNPVSLAGPWRFALDTANAGVDEHWESRELAETVNLPGSLNENGKGTPNPKASPSFLSPLYEYVGAAWYQRDVEIPADWAGRPIELFLERCHWETRLWVDGQSIGVQDSLSVPHVYTVNALAPGQHRLTLRIDNSVKYAVGLRAHSITEHTQTNWNGVVGRMELRAMDAVRLGSVEVYPDARERTATVKCLVHNAAKQAGHGTIAVSTLGVSDTKEVTLTASGDTAAEFLLHLGADVPLWEASDPRLIDLDIALTAETDGKKYSGTQRVRFGLRDIGRDGSQLTLNGRPYFVRGTLECCIFPLTGYPAMDTAQWRNMMETARQYGLNHFRFHSWCPPEAAFEAADEAGITFQIETPVWTDLGKFPDLDQYIRDESDRILASYGNHPSFAMLAVGNEPSGPNKDVFLTDIVKYWQEKDHRRLYTTCAGWPELPISDFHVVHERGKKPYRLHGGPLGPNTMVDYRDVLEGCERPAIAHELGQWCVYPDYREIPKYTGTLRARNLEGFRESLRRNGMLDQASEFSWASGQLQRLMYKADIEAVLRTPGAGGFQLLALQDFPGQGSALEGFLDAFWDSKGATTPDQFRQFCSDTVPLLRLEKLVWTSNETVLAKAEIAHYDTQPIAHARPFWTARFSDGSEIARGEWPERDIPIGNGIAFGEIDLDLKKAEAPAKLTLTVGLAGTAIQNSWNLWVYPEYKAEPTSKRVRIVKGWSNEVASALRRGERVLLLPEHIAPKYSVKSAFEPIFWNTQWFPGQNRQLGVLCDPRHPAFAGFPNDGYTDWQWWELLNQSRVVRLDDKYNGFYPLVQIIDDWNKNRPLGAVFEVRVSKGRLLVCTLDIDSNLPHRPVAAALRKSLLDYMNSDAFAPDAEMPPSYFDKVFTASETLVSQVEADSAVPGFAPENAVDGDSGTIWHTPWEEGAPGFPHALKILYHREIAFAGLRYVPRQDVANGFTRQYEIYAAKDGRNWGAPIAKGEFPKGQAPQEIRFSAPVRTRWLRFVALTSHDGEPFAAVAEIEPILGKE